MKIEKTNGRLSNAEFNTDTHVSRAQNTKAASFEDTFDNYKHQAFEEQLSALLEEIQESGEHLSKSITVDSLIKYKNLVSRFLDHVVNKALLLDKNNAFDVFGRRKALAVIKKVDHKLEQLTAMVFEQQKDNLEILRTIEDIQGLLIDIKV